MDSEIKLELTDEPRSETQVENIKIDDSISSDKNESISTEDITVNKDQDVENNDDIKETSNKKLDEPMEVDEKENTKLETIIDNDNQQKMDIQIEHLNNKSVEIVDKQNDCKKPENTEEESKQSDVQENDKNEQIQKVKNTVPFDDAESNAGPISKEIKDTQEEIPSDENSKSKHDTKIIFEQTVKSKECATSVESVDRLKAMFPELEVVHKDIATPTIDKISMHKPLQQIDQTIAHLLATSYQNPIKWPKVKPINFITNNLQFIIYILLIDRNMH